MSKIGNINLELTEFIEAMGIENTPDQLTDNERAAVKIELINTIEKNSCESDCPHKLMLGLL
jgi:hypothetical protein